TPACTSAFRISASRLRLLLPVAAGNRIAARPPSRVISSSDCTHARLSLCGGGVPNFHSRFASASAPEPILNAGFATTASYFSTDFWRHGLVSPNHTPPALPCTIRFILARLA